MKLACTLLPHLSRVLGLGYNVDNILEGRAGTASCIKGGWKGAWMEGVWLGACRRLDGGA